MKRADIDWTMQELDRQHRLTLRERIGDWLDMLDREGLVLALAGGALGALVFLCGLALHPW